MINVLRGLIDLNDQNIIKVKTALETLRKQGVPKEDIDKITTQLKIMEDGQKKLKRKVNKIAKTTGGNITIPTKKGESNG